MIGIPRFTMAMLALCSRVSSMSMIVECLTFSLASAKAVDILPRGDTSLFNPDTKTSALADVTDCKSSQQLSSGVDTNLQSMETSMHKKQ